MCSFVNMQARVFVINVECSAGSLVHAFLDLYLHLVQIKWVLRMVLLIYSKTKKGMLSPRQLAMTY